MGSEVFLCEKNPTDSVLLGDQQDTDLSQRGWKQYLGSTSLGLQHMLEYKKDSLDYISMLFPQLEAPILSQGHFRGVHTWELAKLFLGDD